MQVQRIVVEKLRTHCLALPEAFEEPAWVGTRWMIRTHNFAHVLMIQDGSPPAYARAAATDGPVCVLTFRCPVEELEAFRHLGAPYFLPAWFPNIVGMMLDDTTNWVEVAELITDSYCLLAPKKLAALVDRPAR